MIKTAHFEIFYSAQHHDLGLYYAKIAEKSYLEITRVFSIKPTEKIVVIINDSTDISNGFTTLIPYPYIMIYPVQIGKDESLSESGEWAKELFIHELAHIFQLYPATGYYKWIKPLLGNIVAPNLLTPLWWKEGMAVEIETQLSPQGRSRSYSQDASIRALVNEDKLFKYTLSEANEVLPTWPYGGRPYLFGSMLMGQIAQSKSFNVTTNNLDSLVVNTSSRFPYFIERPIQDLFGHGYESHYFETLSAYQNHAEKQINTLKTKPTSDENSALIDSLTINSKHPRYNLNDKTLAQLVTEKSGKKLIFYTLNNDSKWIRKDLKKLPKNDISSFEFHSKSSKIIYAKTDNVNSKEIFSDLYIYDYNSDQNIQITNSARARNPVWGFNSNEIFFISTFNGKTQLAKLIFNSELLTQTPKSEKVISRNIETLFETPFNERIREVIVLNSNYLLLNISDSQGIFKAYSFDLNLKKLTEYPLKNKQAERFKIKTGKLFFTSTMNGVSNIYYQDLNTKEEYPISNFQTGATEFDILDNLESGFVTVYTSSGFQVITYRPMIFESLPIIKNDFRDRYNYVETIDPEINIEVNDAQSFKYLYPHYFIPFVSTSTNSDGLYFQLITSGQDPLLIHRYNLSLDYDTYIQKSGYNFNYLNSYFEWLLEFDSYKKYRSYGLTTKALEKNETALAVTPDLFSISSHLQMNIGLLTQSTDDSTVETDHIGAFSQILYKDVTQTLFNIYPVKGWSALIRYENNKATDRDTTNSLKDFEQISGAINLYTNTFLPEDHSLAFKLSFLHTPQSVSSRFGTSNVISASFTDSLYPEYLFRGYSLGQFYGNRLVTYNQEYRFPIKVLNKGSGTDPYFLKRINGAIILDGLAVKGAAYDKNKILAAEDMTNSYWSYGAEARLETTLGYLLPVNFILGFYVPMAPKFSDSAQTAISLQIGGFNH